MLLTYYTLLGMLIFTFVIVLVATGNKFTKSHLLIMLLFPVHSFLALLLCWAGYTIYFYLKLRKICKGSEL